MGELLVKDLGKTFIMNKRENKVLNNINFSVKEGDMTAIMGPSGSGKSTLLYTVSGMDNMTSGEVVYFGKKLSKLSDNEISDVRLNEMGFIFQQMHMMGNLSVFDNIILPAYQSNKEKDRKKINKRAKKLMEKMGIIDIADHDIDEVSGGQLQRACICRSLINHPRVIFADEPTGALNQNNSKEVMDELAKVNADNTTILLVTHDMKVAARCKKVLYIEDGEIKGEFEFDKDTKEKQSAREKKLLKWLSERGW